MLHARGTQIARALPQVKHATCGHGGSWAAIVADRKWPVRPRHIGAALSGSNCARNMEGQARGCAPHGVCNRWQRLRDGVRKQFFVQSSDKIHQRLDVQLSCSQRYGPGVCCRDPDFALGLTLAKALEGHYSKSMSSELYQLTSQHNDRTHNTAQSTHIHLKHPEYIAQYTHVTLHDAHITQSAPSISTLNNKK